MTHLAKKTETPGRFTFHSQSEWSARHHAPETPTQEAFSGVTTLFSPLISLEQRQRHAGGRRRVRRLRSGAHHQDERRGGRGPQQALQ